MQLTCILFLGSDRGAKSPNVSSTEKPPIPKVHSVKKATPSKGETTPRKPSDKPKLNKVRIIIIILLWGAWGMGNGLK